MTERSSAALVVLPCPIPPDLVVKSQTCKPFSGFALIFTTTNRLILPMPMASRHRLCRSDARYAHEIIITTSILCLEHIRAYHTILNRIMTDTGSVAARCCSCRFCLEHSRGKQNHPRGWCGCRRWRCTGRADCRCRVADTETEPRNESTRGRLCKRLRVCAGCACFGGYC